MAKSRQKQKCGAKEGIAKKKEKTIGAI